MSDKKILNEVIIAYRQLIEQRYQYASIQEQFEIPESFDEARTDMVRDYFLTHIYPPPTKRQELEVAFHSLDNYIKHPEKLLRILLDSGSLLFKYGRHLPKILKAGIKALKSFRSATRFEQKLVQTALASKLVPPYSTKDVRQLVGSLSKKDVANFIEDSQDLFNTLQDRKLVQKILEIVNHLIAKMEKRPSVYSETEVSALKIGKDIIKEGDLLFAQLSKAEQEQILAVVLEIERNALEKVFQQT